MTEDEQISWGAKEHTDRMADIIEVKANRMTLAEAQKRARKRSRLSGMTPHQSYSAMMDGSRRKGKP